MIDLMRRYFTANHAPIFRIERLRMTAKDWKIIPCNCGNAGGFFWGNWRVMWRKPYSKVWGFDGRHWVHAYTLQEKA